MNLNDSTISSSRWLSSARIEDYLDSEGHLAVPEGATLPFHVDRSIAELGDMPAYRFLDYSGGDDPQPVELSWDRLGIRMRAVGARLQQVTTAGDRAAILAPQGLDYVVGVFAAVAAGNVAVPLFAPELPGHVERLHAVLADAEPAVVLTSTETAQGVRAFLRTLAAPASTASHRGRRRA